MSQLLSDEKITKAYAQGIQSWTENPPSEPGTHEGFNERQAAARRAIALEQHRADIRWLRGSCPHKMVTAPYRRRWDCGACRWEFERGV